MLKASAAGVCGLPSRTLYPVISVKQPQRKPGPVFLRGGFDIGLPQNWCLTMARGQVVQYRHGLLGGAGWGIHPVYQRLYQEKGQFL